MSRFIVLLICSTLFLSCKNDKNGDFESSENVEAKRMLQGVWIDDATETPIINIKGDSIFYRDPSNSPVMFKIIDDSIFTYGNVVNSYKIEKINEYNLWFNSAAGDMLKFTKSENSYDLNVFTLDKPIEIYNEVIKKDSVIQYHNKRYRGYVYINPSTMKVTQTRVSEDGLNVDNVYYDNIIHICIYEGNKRLCSKDINKNMMKSIIPNDFLANSILSDMDFVGVRADGYLYQATICIPNDASCYLVNITIDDNSEVKFGLAR